MAARSIPITRRHPPVRSRIPSTYSTAQLQRLVSLLDESDVSEIEVKRAAEGMHLVLRKAKVPASHDPGELQVVAPVPAEIVALVEDEVYGYRTAGWHFSYLGQAEGESSGSAWGSCQRRCPRKDHPIAECTERD